MRSNCFSGNIQFIKGRKEALEQLDKEVKKLNNANWATAPPFLVRLAHFTALILAIALVLPYREQLSLYRGTTLLKLLNFV